MALKKSGGGKAASSCCADKKTCKPLSATPKESNGKSGRTTQRECRVEAIVSVDGRGQLVLPKELRERSGIRAGERFALTSWDMGGCLCCITLTRVEELAPALKAALGSLMHEIVPEE